MSLYDRPLPHNTEAEEGLIGVVLMSPNLLDYARDLEPSDFYHPFLREVWEAILQLDGEGLEIDHVNVLERVENEHITATFLLGLGVGVPPLVTIVKSHVNIIKGHSIKRKLLFKIVKLERDILEGDTSAGTIVAEAESAILTLNDKLHVKGEDSIGFRKLHTITDEMAEQFVNYHEGIATGVPTGMPEIDEMLDGGGLQKGAMYVLGASEKVGKTSLVLDWIDYTAKVTKKRALVATLEMAMIVMAKRLFSKHAGISYYRFRPGFKGKEYERAFQELEDFGKVPIEIADNLFGLSQIALYARRAVEQGYKSGKPEDEVGLLFIDYLQLVEDDTGQTTTTREREIAKISRRLRKLSIELDIPIVVVSNLNREGLGAVINEKKALEAVRPSTRNLRDSGAIGFDAEAVMFLHNPAYIPGRPYQPMPHTPIEFIMDRQRNGPTGTIPMMFIGEFMQFFTQSQYRAFMNDPVVTITPRDNSEALPEPARQGQDYLYADDGFDDED